MRETKSKPCVEIRPNFAEQIRSVEELKVGEKVTQVYSHLPQSQSEKYKILSIKDKRMQIQVFDEKGEHPHEREVSLADCGVIAYETKLWNPTNYLVHGWAI